jgi:phage gpG-like protein
MFSKNCETVKNGYGVEVKICPSRAAMKKDVDAAREKIKDQKTPYKRASVLLDQWVQRNFKTEGDFTGGWTSFSNMNRRWMSDPSAKLLQDTGRLRSSFKPFASIRDAGIGSDLKYSEPHNEGLGHLPERRMLPNEKDAWPIVQKVWGLHIKEAFKQ